MKKSLFAGATLTALFSGHALANEPLTLVLDWYINPDHAPIMVAEQIGAFKAQGLDVRIIPPFRSRAASAHGGRPSSGSGHHLPAAGALLC